MCHASFYSKDFQGQSTPFVRFCQISNIFEPYFSRNQSQYVPKEKLSREKEFFLKKKNSNRTKSNY